MFSRSNASYREVPVDPSRAVAMSTSIGQPTRFLSDDDAPPIADYDYPPVYDRNTCKCRGGRLIGRINLMREVPILDGEQHPHYPGLRTRICCVIPAGWPMLFLTISLILVPAVAMLVNIHPTAAYYGWFVMGTTSVLCIVTLLNVTFRDPGVFPRYSRPMGESDKWARFEKTNSFRCGWRFCYLAVLLLSRPPTSLFFRAASCLFFAGSVVQRVVQACGRREEPIRCARRGASIHEIGPGSGRARRRVG
jgi:hypothetical protein